MGLPTIQRTWTIIPNIRITTNDGVVAPGTTGSMQKYLYQFKQVMTLSGSYVLKGSAANGTGAMDGVDRWPNPQSIFAGTADAKSATGNTVQFPTGVLGDMAWVCLTDAGGTDIVLGWQGTVNCPDAPHIAISPGGLFVTSSYHANGAVFPTASDECHIVSNALVNVVGCVTSLGDTTRRSADKILNFWIANDGRSFRVGPALYSGTFGTAAGAAGDLRWGVEQVQMTTRSGTVVWSGSWGFADRSGNAQGQVFAGAHNGSNSFPAGGQASMSIGGVFRQVQLVRGGEMFNNTVSTWNNVLVAAQGETAYYLWPVPFAGLTSPAQGKFGNLVDWWRSDCTTAGAMDTYGILNFVHVGSADGVVWPWDGVTTPITS